MKIISLLAFFLLPQLLFSQHYYLDIMAAHEQGLKMEGYATHKVRSINASGFDNRGMKSPDFNEITTVDLPGLNYKVASRNGLTIVRSGYFFDSNYRLIRSTDNNGALSSVTTYKWNEHNQISGIETITKDSLSDFNETRVHQYVYSPEGKLSTLWRIINGNDSTEYRFTSDENGNIIEEQLFRRNTGLDKIYYYYDEVNRLTDIVRFDKKTQRLLPDLMFEYDEQDRVSQKISLLSAATKNYLIWRNIYNEKGLKSKEALFNKDRELTGRVEYTYSY